MRDEENGIHKLNASPFGSAAESANACSIRITRIAEERSQKSSQVENRAEADET
jgi:hypothetical protein